MLNNKIFKIGIFDSGVGGLTIARAISDVLPSEQILYVGDTAHSPWGNKSQAQIVNYSKHLTEFLLNNNCDFIVIACNTASCVALNDLQEEFPGVDFFNVIDPIVDYLEKLNLHEFNDIGIIGTKQTIKSHAYQKHIAEIKIKLNIKGCLNIKSLATPLLVPIIEEGWKENAISNLVVAEYLSSLGLQDQSILILGCTHYPLIKNQIEDFYINLNKKITVIDSTNVIAQEIKNVIIQHKSNKLPHSTSKEKFTHIANVDNYFYCTCDNEFFIETAKQFFDNVKLNFLPLWQ